MAAMAGPSISEGQSDSLSTLYPAVNEDETPLPRSWSPKDKFHYIGLSQGNLRVHYKGQGKTHKDAASVRATYPIPASCGIYYFEVKIISKGRDGYMGIGLSVQGVNLNRLPGWDKHSYGYHGDDGHSFCSSGTGQKYGPTFSTGDIVGCCVNLIDHTCFYTLNGVNLGTAFRELPNGLFPTVGLQTPGEVVEANFGCTPFCFDIKDYMREWRLKTQNTIEQFPVEDRQGEWQMTLHTMVSTYLVHHGYCATAESFARSTGQAFEEELTSIQNRQRIQKLVLAGRIGEAIETTQHLYPGLLERHPNLMFMLKCRQFIEMVNGTDSEVRAGSVSVHSPRSHHTSANTSPNMSPMHLLPSSSSSSRSQGSHIIPPSTLSSSSSSSPSGRNKASAQAPASSSHPPPPPPPPHHSSSTASTSSNSSSSSSSSSSASSSAMSTPTEPSTTAATAQQNPQAVAAAAADNLALNQEDVLNRVNAINGSGDTGAGNRGDSDVDMDTCESGEDESVPSHNGVSNGVTNGASGDAPDDDEQFMDTGEQALGRPVRQICGGSQAAMERMLAFGRKLQNEHGGPGSNNSKALHDAFSLLAYGDPWNSPVGHQLEPVQREPVCAALNSAILESHNLPKQPPLELAIGQASQCMKLMAKSGVGSCAFASVGDYLH